MDVVKLEECKEKNPMTLLLQRTNTLYVIELRNDKGEFVAKAFKSMKEAKKMFDTLSGWMIIGAYTQSERWNYLIHGTMK